MSVYQSQYMSSKIGDTTIRCFTQDRRRKETIQGKGKLSFIDRLTKLYDEGGKMSQLMDSSQKDPKDREGQCQNFFTQTRLN